MISGGALATTVLADRTTLWEIPDKWTMAQAATIPRLYLVVSIYSFDKFFVN